MRKAVLFVVLILFAVLIVGRLSHVEDENITTDAPALNGEPVSALSTESNENLSAKISNEQLSMDIQSLVNDDGADYAVFVSYPKEHRRDYVYGSKPMRSASMIKVFVLASAMEQIREQHLAMEESVVLRSSDKVGGAGVLIGYPSGERLSLSKIMKLMISESDNTATNIMIDILGMENINSYIKRNGYHDTILQRKMMDLEAVSAGRENYTSVQDLGLFFKRLYHHNCVDYYHDELMLNYLKEQADTECFPNALPNAMIAHKTGELAGLYNDGGIVYNNETDFILVIMTEDYTSRKTTIETMKKIVLCVAENPI